MIDKNVTLSAVITGGSSGIGLAVARKLNSRGVTTHDFSRRSGIDVTDAEVVERAYAAFHETPQFLVASAGIGAPGPAFPEAPLDAWRRVLDVNLTGVFIVASAHVRRLLRDGLPGRIVLFGSSSGRRPSMENLAYGVSKAAIVALGIGLARGLEQHGIKVFILCPSYVDTPMLRARWSASCDSVPLLRPEDMAREVAHYLLDDTYIDGQAVYIANHVIGKQQ